MSIRAMIFDLGGVLIRTEDRSPRAQLAARLAISYEKLNALVFDSPSSRKAMLGEITAVEHWEAVREALGLSEAEMHQVKSEFWSGDNLDKNLVDYLRAVRKHYKTALLSNTWDNMRRVIEDRWMIADAFDEIVISAEVGLVKPDPRIYKKVLSDLNVKPAEAVFVDDFPENINGADRVGMHTVLFKNPNQALKDLERLLDGK
jgi:epoxide hydrolase-like predicted phosphatase